MNVRGVPGFAAGIAFVLAVSAVTSAMTFTSGHVERIGASGQVARPAVGWQFVGSDPGTTPRPVPGLVSAAAGAPTRLPLGGVSFQLNPGTSGHRGVGWSFNESPNVAPNEEWELVFVLHFVAGGVPRTFLATVYVETQATAPLTTATYHFLWDGGRRAVTPSSELEISQLCPAVGSCP